MTISEKLMLLGIASTFVVALINLIYTNKLTKGLKVYDIRIQELHELNIKMHDRLVDVEVLVTSGDSPSEEVKKRLLYNASRYLKYDATIIEDVRSLIYSWTELGNRSEIDPLDDEIPRLMAENLEQIKKIRTKIDRVQREYK